jgi:glycerophosphoryl diester phosphodiesterase
MAGIILILISLVGLWLLPALIPPNWAYQGDLPAKPALLAHRGASMLAPENTLAAIELAGEYQAFGFETDIRISRDGVPFLMHDATLSRTTNVTEVFPERAEERASSFDMESLKQLNAGLWFIQQDPFGSIDAGFVSQSQLGINQGQGIPTLSEALSEVEAAGMVILFDMREPPPGHPFHEDFFEIVLSQCRESGLNEDLWFMVDWSRLPTVRDEAPQLTRVMGASSTDLPSPQRLLEAGVEIINVDTGISAREIQAYREKGLGVNVYTIDEPWLFSQFWLSGVTSVTTNNVQTFSQIEQPSLNIPYSQYLLYWGLFGIIVAIWLAGSHPEPEPQEPREMETPDLLDFAQNEVPDSLLLGNDEVDGQQEKENTSADEASEEES